MSDGGGLQDLAQQQHIKGLVKKIADKMAPPVYHPISLPGFKESHSKESETQTLLTMVHGLLNATNPTLARDYWLCLHVGPSRLSVMLIDFNFTKATYPSHCVVLPPEQDILIVPNPLQ